MQIMGLWSESDIKWLKNEYPTKGKVYCAEKLNRSVSSIRWKASDLGLKQDRESDFFSDWQSRAAKSKDGDVWTEQQIKFLRENFYEFGQRSVAKSLNRTEKSVQVKASRLGLIQSQECTSRNKQGIWGKISFDRQEELRQIRSDSTMLMQAHRHPRVNYSRGNQGERKDINLYVRSSWEANYARYLNWLKNNNDIYKWEYESETFWFLAIKRGVRSYKPDFKIWSEIDSNPYYVEVKGWMDQKSRTKLSRMAKYYPDVKIELVGVKEYKSIEKAMSSIIPNWE